MALRTAAKLCPHSVFLSSHYELYGKYSDQFATILGKYSPIVEMASIDEAYIDLTGTEKLHGAPLAAAHKLLTEITASTGLPCSGGLASTRLVAKIASEQAKPRGLVWVPAANEESFLAPLAVRRIPGIGKVTDAGLKDMGIETIAQLQKLSAEKLEQSFGAWGQALYRKARGIDAYEFFVDAEPKSISHNQTFSEDTRDRAQLETTLSHLCQKAVKRLRDHHLHARTVTLTLRFANFVTITRSESLTEPADLDSVFMPTMRRLFDRAWDGRLNLRLVGVALTAFSGGPQQFDLLDPTRREKLERLAQTTDRLRDRFGFSKLQFGGSLASRDDRK
jgi:DNA polymerase-4